MRNLTAKDLINVGVFTAIYFVIMFALGMVGFAGPWLMFVGHGVAMLANGVVIALYLSRTPKFGALTLLMAVVSILMVLTGHVWYQVIIGTLLGLAGDTIASLGKYRSAQANSIAYAVMSLWYVVPMLPVVYDSKGYTDYIAQSMGQEYADGFMSIMNSGTLAIWAGVVLVVAYLGGLLGHRVLHRHFQRSGLA